MATFKTGPNGSVGLVTDIDTTPRNRIGTIAKGQDGYGDAEFIYLYGCASTIAGSVVTFNRATGATTLIVADASGPVAVAMSANTSTTAAGWYCISGCPLVDVVANSAAYGTTSKNPGRETTDGKVGDGRAAGDEINNFFQLTATTAAALVNCMIDHPFVNNATGS